MMLSSASSVATLVTLLALFLIAPRLAAYIFGFAFKLIGLLIARKYRWRRDLIRARIRLEEEEYQSRKAKNAKQEDEDWEKVETSGVGATSNGNAAEDNWEGMIGFFIHS
ncbi:hypothetical protein ACJ72_05799, partial [Emergomyces africanus]